MKITKIEISKAPNLIPITLTDEVFIDQELMIEQSDDPTLTNWDGQSDILVYSEVYDIYSFQFLANQETYKGLQNIKYGTITVTTDTGYTHKAVVTDFDEDEVEGTFFKFLTITYKDLDSVKYSRRFDFVNFPSLLDTKYTELKLENFESDGTTPKAIDSQWSSIAPANSYIAESNLRPIESVSDATAETDNRTGITVSDFTAIGNTVRVRLYLSKDQKNNILKYIQLVSKVTITYDVDVYILKENVIPTVSEIGNDVYQVELTGKYDNTTYNHY